MPHYFKGRAKWKKQRETARKWFTLAQGGGISHRQLGLITNIGLLEHATPGWR